MIYAFIRPQEGLGTVSDDKPIPFTLPQALADIDKIQCKMSKYQYISRGYCLKKSLYIGQKVTIKSKKVTEIKTKVRKSQKSKQSQDSKKKITKV